MAFHWNWFSKTGSARSQNQDFAGIAIHEGFLFAVIADGVSSRQGSGELARKLVFFLVNRAIELDHQPSGLEVGQWVVAAFDELKMERKPKISTSFLAACFSRDQLLFAVHAGDCRVGVKDENHGVVWKTSVHSLATATKPLSEAELIRHPVRNQITRSFNTWRLSEFEVTELCCGYGKGAALVTDGFWAGMSAEFQCRTFATPCQFDVACDDDVSRLSIRWEPGGTTGVAAAKNLYVRYR